MCGVRKPRTPRSEQLLAPNEEKAGMLDFGHCTARPVSV